MWYLAKLEGYKVDLTDEELQVVPMGGEVFSSEIEAYYRACYLVRNVREHENDTFVVLSEDQFKDVLFVPKSCAPCICIPYSVPKINRNTINGLEANRHLLYGYRYGSISKIYHPQHNIG